MLKLLKAFRQDEYGVILSAEIVIVGTLLVLGVMTGMVCLQKSVNGELGDFAKAIDCLDQSYSLPGFRKSGGGYGNSNGCCAYTAGSAFHNNGCNTACRNDIVGCDAQVLQNSSCGTCGIQIGSCGDKCGSCGGQCGAGGGCSSCGSAGGATFWSPNRPNCVSTGVPKMKVTEYPGTDNVPRTSNAGKSAIRFPELEVQPFEPAYRQPMPAVEEQYVPQQHQHDHSAIQPEQRVYLHEQPQGTQFQPQQQFENIQPHGPVPSNVPGPPESTESLRPIPETQPIPAAPPEPKV